MKIRRPLLTLAVVLPIAVLTACAGGAAPERDPAAGDAPTQTDNHGEIAGAAEVTEPPLALLSIDAEGAVGLLDLLDGTTSSLGPVDAPLALTSDGRYGFVTTATGLDVIDSGRWSWDHADHFHYYLAPPRAVGSVPGEGPATVATGMLSTAGSTGVFFSGSGEAVLLDNEALSDGRIAELFRIQTDADSGIVAPLADGALVTEGTALVFYDQSGVPSDETTQCAAPSGSITTRVGVVVGCSDAAVLATWDEAAVVFERIPYPAEVDADRAMSFDARKGRPTVAGVAGTSGFWLLDTRERNWHYVPTEVPLARVSAVDDEHGHVVAIDVDGRVRVYLAEAGQQVVATEPLLTEVGPSASLSLESQRAYINDAAGEVVYEIDYADGARIARTLATPTVPQFFAETGR